MSDAVVPAPAQVVVRDIVSVAEAAVRLMPTYKIRKTNSKTFRCLTLAEDENVNWKKGLVYLIARYKAGVNLEMWMYSTKGGAHLAEYNDQIRPLAKGAIKCESLGSALKLRLPLADAMKTEDMEAAILEFMSSVEPTLTELRTKITVHVSKKETKAKAKTEATAETKAETPVEETKVEAPAAEAPAAKAAPLSKRQQKKAAKREAKAKAAA